MRNIFIEWMQAWQVRKEKKKEWKRKNEAIQRYKDDKLDSVRSDYIYSEYESGHKDVETWKAHNHFCTGEYDDSGSPLDWRGRDR